MSLSKTAEPRFGTFAGVFTPTAITILGVIMYLRMGWVVGNAGLVGAWVIIFAALTIAVTAALSLSSIATNTRLYAGGAYAIISRSLGMEAGASVGLALYLAQALATTMYIFGFREGWLTIFPDHSALMVDAWLFVAVMAVALFSSQWAMRVQYLVLAITGISIICIAMGPWRIDPSPVKQFGDFATAGGGYSGFWNTFAVFFPAVTGVMAGANMSGELKNPRRSIPRGTLTAVAISGAIYFYLAYALAHMGTSKELQSNFYILVDRSAWGWFIQIAILAATSSSALASLVGAPRILQALANDDAFPWSETLKKRSQDGEPRNAILFTGIVAGTCILFRDLNAIAPLITICFLATYAMINGVVLIEQGLGLVSFRPRLKLPLSIPFVGATSALIAMIIINPAVSIALLSSLTLMYAVLTRRAHLSQDGDLRGNIFVALAQWAARETQALPKAEARAWKPHSLTPILDHQACLNGLDLATDIATPGGAVKLLRLRVDKKVEPQLPDLIEHIQKTNVFCTAAEVTTPDRTTALNAAMQVVQADFFKPNILSLGLDDGFSSTEISDLIDQAREAQMGVILRCPTQRTIGNGGIVNVWIRPQLPHWDVKVAQAAGNLDLALLVALRLSKGHDMRIQLTTTLSDTMQRHLAENYLRNLVEEARLPKNAIVIAKEGDLWSALKDGPDSTVHIFGLPTPYSPEFIDKALAKTKTACLFVKGSGLESILE